MCHFKAPSVWKSNPEMQHLISFLTSHGAFSEMHHNMWFWFWSTECLCITISAALCEFPLTQIPQRLMYLKLGLITRHSHILQFLPACISLIGKRRCREGKCWSKARLGMHRLPLQVQKSTSQVMKSPSHFRIGLPSSAALCSSFPVVFCSWLLCLHFLDRKKHWITAAAMWSFFGFFGCCFFVVMTVCVIFCTSPGT